MNPLNLNIKTTLLADAVRSSRLALLVVSPADGMLVAASETGYAALGLDTDRIKAPVSLDTAMPALAALKGFDARARKPGPTILPLTFWTTAGAHTWTCKVCRPKAAESAGTLLITIDDGSPEALAAFQPSPAPAESRASLGLADVAAAQIGLAEGGGATQTTAAVPMDNGTHDHVPPSASARLAHEMRTPLSAILSLSELMAEGRFGPVGNERYQDYLGTIRDAARHLVGVVETMLDEHSLQTGTPKQTLRAVDLNDAVRHAFATCRPLARAAGADLTSTLHETMPRVIADRQSIIQILINLVMNGIRHGREPGRNRQVIVTTGFAASQSAWIAVDDDGPGFAADLLARMSGATGPIATASALPGANGTGDSYGLGLPLCQTLAKAMGAGLEFGRSHLGGGHVRLTFPSSRVAPA